MLCYSFLKIIRYSFITHSIFSFKNIYIPIHSSLPKLQNLRACLPAGRSANFATPALLQLAIFLFRTLYNLLQFYRNGNSLVRFYKTFRFSEIFRPLNDWFNTAKIITIFFVLDFISFKTSPQH